MPEISFYITDDERKDLFDIVRSKQATFVSDILYDKPQIMEIQNSEELIDRINRKEETTYFVVLPIFQIEPLLMKQFEENYERIKGKYYIMQRTGGPCIRISFYLGFADDAYIKYKRTDIDYYARYLHYDWQTNYGEFPATEELKSYYKMIVKFLKSKCRQVTAKNGKKYWVSKTLKEEDVV